MKRILFVCMGNICRSPTAHGVFASIAEEYPELELEIDSAGTHSYHIGHPPDRRTQEVAIRRGYDLSSQRARQVTVEDFDRFDLILAMDTANLSHMHSMANEQQKERIRLFLEFGSDPSVRDVPDPYYGGDTGFERVLDLVEDAAQGLLAHLRNTRS